MSEKSEESHSIIAYAHYPRGKVSLHKGCLKYTQEFLTRLKKIMEQKEADRFRSDLEQFEQDFGSFYIKTADVGGTIRSQQYSEANTTKAIEKEKVSYKAKFDAEIAFFSLNGSYEQTQTNEQASKSKKKEYALNSKLTAIGGAGEFAGPNDWGKWKESVLTDPKTWRIINITKIESIYDLLDGQSQMKIKEKKEWAKTNQFNEIDWKLEICPFDKISSNGKRFKTKRHCIARTNQPMVFGTGKYKIGFQVINVSRKFYSNAIGICTDAYTAQNAITKRYWFQSSYYCAWSAKGGERGAEGCPVGIYSGQSKKQQNIFYQSVEYVGSLKGLPSFGAGDMIELVYDSDNGSLNFVKNDQSVGKLTKIPTDKNRAMYWMIGGDEEGIEVIIHH